MADKKSLILKKTLTIVLLFNLCIGLLFSADNKSASDVIPKISSPADRVSLSGNIRLKQSDIFDLQINKADIEKLEQINIPKFFKSAETGKSYIYLVKTFTLPGQFRNKRTVLALNGAKGELQVFLNKKSVFKKVCYNGDFYINISKELKSDKSPDELMLVFNTLNFEKSTFGLKSINIKVLPEVHHAVNDASSDSSGIFINAEDINFMTKSANIKVRGIIINDATGDRTVNYSGMLINQSDNKKTEITDMEITLKPGEVYNLSIEKKISGLDLWSCEKPNLYKYYSVIKQGDTVIDIEEAETGFKKLEYIYNREENRTGLYLNKEFIFLTGFNYSYENDWQFSDNTPELLTDYTMKLIKDTNANIIRLSDEFPAEKVISSCGNNGILIICQIKNEEEFKALLSKYKNSPCLIFFEIDKKNLTPEKINNFNNISDVLSPGFKRFFGAQAPAFAVSESLDWIGTNSGRYYKEDIEKSKPVMEINSLDFNSGRNSFNMNNIKDSDQDKIFLDDGSYAKLLINEYNRFFSRNINSGVSERKIWSGLILSAFNDYLINEKEINYSGIVDLLKIKKKLYGIYRIMQGAIDKKYEINIINRWNYNEGDSVDVLAASDCDTVRLYINNKHIQTNRTPINRYLFKFENIIWQKGTIRADGYKNFKKVCSAEKKTFGKPDKIKLSFEQIPGCSGADSSNVILLNAEILDENDEQCLSYNDAIELAVEGPCTVVTKNMKDLSPNKDNIYSLKINSGINRIIIQSTAGTGIIKIKASGTDIKPGELKIGLKN